MNNKAIDAKHATDTRSRLLEAATELFAKQGYDATSTREIAAIAGCNISLISHYFGGKQGLLREILSDWFDIEERELRSLIETDTSPAELIPGFIDIFFDLAYQHRYVMRIIQREMANTENPTAEYTRGRIDTNFGMIVELIGRSSGMSRYGVPPRTLANMLMGMILFCLDGDEITDRRSGEGAKRFIKSCFSQMAAGDESRPAG